jgi:para-aminobenzoate synthetase/4-amino-4-deoxychorismate lyase
MEIIRELEPAPRGVYTGAIGWFDPPGAGHAIGDFCLSVPIRTLTLQPEAHGVRAGEMGVGAGIVYDSVAAEEYAECQLKARFLTGLSNDFELFETMQVVDGCCHLLEQHMARLAGSAQYFGFRYDAQTVVATVSGACAALGPGRFRMRLALTSDGAINLQTAPLAPLTQPVKLILATQQTYSRDLFLRHKTSVRTVYDAAWRAAEAQGAFDALFFNERGELTEGGRSNVFVKFGERWFTPARECGVLPGVMRAAILADPACNVTEGVITAAMLTEAVEFMVCNSLRGAMRAILIR